MDGWGVLQEAADLARRGEPFALATVVWRQAPSSSQQGSRAIITADGQLSGWIGGACAEPAVTRAAREVIETGTARLLLLGSPEQFGYQGAAHGTAASGAQELPEGMTFVPIACQSEGALEVYIEPMLPVPHLVVIGSSPMATTLVELARALGWQADLVAGQDFTAADASERSLVVVATQGHDDEGVLERAAAARPAYLGLVGSHRRGEAVLGYLTDRGIDPGLLKGVHVPAGLDLGSTTHQEIAVAILAELVQLRAGGGLGSSSAVSARAAKPRPATTDPVCGMTVEPGPASRSADYEGRTYHFCGPGCEQAFQTDPAAYAKRDSRC
ncbi:MAG TPA: XdhC family protein [Streptosporangiaceae bacterium]|nr:XdhC family protein [Streptosporangiaceae bacterium]